MRGTIPNFVIPATKADRVRLNRAAAVPADFIERSVRNAMQQTLRSKRSTQSTPDTPPSTPEPPANGS